jgi:hypothetical protein
MAPLATNPVIVDHLATKATDKLFSSKTVQNEITSALPANAKPIVTPITGQVKNYVQGLALNVFESPKFSQLWNGLNRRSHAAVVDILTGKQSALTKRLEKGGAIVVNVTPALGQVIDKANSRGITLFNPLKAVLSEGNSLGVTVVSKSQVSQFSGIFNLIVKLRWAIPVLALVLAAIGIAVAVERRKTLLRMALGVGIFSLVLLAVLGLARTAFITKASGHVNGDVATVVWDTVIRFLKTSLRWTVLASALVAFGAWLAGPARYAVWIRSTVARGWHWLATQAHELTAGAGRSAAGSDRARHTGGWILEHLNGLRIVGVVLAGLFVVFGGNLTGWSLLVIVIVLAAYLGLLQLVAAWAHKVSVSAASSGTA